MLSSQGLGSRARFGLLLIGLVLVGPRLAPAAGMASFRLTNVDPAGSAPVREVLALVLPTGSVVARDVENDPPTILPESSGFVSSGFDADALQVTLGEGEVEGPGGTAEPFQAIKLDFGPGGLTAGGKLFFQLKWSPQYEAASQDLIRLVLPIDVTNVAIETLSLPVSPESPEAGRPGGTTPPPPQVPEPLPVLLWSVLIAAGAARARVARRRA